MTLRVRLLGAVAATRDGQTVTLGGPRQQALLALLAWAPATPVPHGRIAGELWPGGPPQGAGTTVRAYVSRLRRALGAHIDASPSG